MRIKVTFTDGELEELAANLGRGAAATTMNGGSVPSSYTIQLGRLTRELADCRRLKLDPITLSFFERELTEIEAALLLMAATFEQAPNRTAYIQKTMEDCLMLAGKLGGARREAHEAKAARRWW